MWYQDSFFSCDDEDSMPSFSESVSESIELMQSLKRIPSLFSLFKISKPQPKVPKIINKVAEKTSKAAQCVKTTVKEQTEGKIEIVQEIVEEQKQNIKEALPEIRSQIESAAERVIEKVDDTKTIIKEKIEKRDSNTKCKDQMLIKRQSKIKYVSKDGKIEFTQTATENEKGIASKSVIKSGDKKISFIDTKTPSSHSRTVLVIGIKEEEEADSFYSDCVHKIQQDAPKLADIIPKL